MQKEELWASEERGVEGFEAGFGLGVAVTKQVGGSEVDEEGADGEDAEGPWEAEGLYGAARCERVGHGAAPRAGGGDGVGNASAFEEPLWDDTDGGREEEAHAPAEAEALGEDDLVFFARKGGADEAKGFEEYADMECPPCAVEVNDTCDDGGDQDGLGY